MCYFNALKELGGGRRIVEGEIGPRSRDYGRNRVRKAPTRPEFADRRIDPEVLELTSRVPTDQVAEAKRRLETSYGATPNAETVDVALATNMISVGLDIPRLGLMVVQGQPKAAAEYIQATSRVGRLPSKPGLIAVILNLHKPRDRAHFEQFGAFHASFYRAVEATSVTPWAARALDRSLAAVCVAIIRHIDADLTPEIAVRRLVERHELRSRVRDIMIARAPEASLVGGREALAIAIDGLMDAWLRTVTAQTLGGGQFAFAQGQGGERHLLQDVLDPAIRNLTSDHQRFKAARSMRDVEPAAPVRVRDPYGRPIMGADDLA